MATRFSVVSAPGVGHEDAERGERYRTRFGCPSLRGHRGSRLQSRGKRTNRLNSAFSKLSDDTLTSGKESNVPCARELGLGRFIHGLVHGILAVGLKLGRHSLR